MLIYNGDELASARQIRRGLDLSLDPPFLLRAQSSIRALVFVQSESKDSAFSDTHNPLMGSEVTEGVGIKESVRCGAK